MKRKVERRHLEIIGHRGAPEHSSENSLEGILYAWQVGCRWVEVDLRLISNTLVLFHDDTLDRCTNLGGSVTGLSSETLESIRLTGGEIIPSLESVLLHVTSERNLNVEIKGRGCIPHLISVLKKHEALYPFLLFSSFSHDDLIILKKALPKVRTAPLIYGIPHDLAACVSVCQSSLLIASREFLSENLVDDAHDRGADVWCYTVLNSEDSLQLASMGVSGIFVNDPEAFL